MSQNFKALVISETSEKKYIRSFEEKNTDDLPAGEVLIRVQYSSLNYKDALSSIGNKGVTRKYPHTPGIDAAGIVVESSVPTFQQGDTVIVTSYDLGMNTAGAFAEYIRVPAAWVLPLPNDLTSLNAMIYGTAGLTAGLCIRALQQQGITPDKGEILVSGATGGVGILSVALLAKLGYTVVALTGKPEASNLLMSIGANRIIDRATFEDNSPKPLLKSTYAGAIDTVGGNILASILKSLQYGGAVAACGLVASADLHTSVFPFILRANALVGIDSAECPMPIREEIWQKLASDWRLSDDTLATLHQVVTLEQVPAKLDLMLAGKAWGKVVVAI